MEKEKGKNKFIRVDDETYRDLNSYMEYNGNKSVSEAAESILRPRLRIFKYRLRLEAQREGHTEEDSGRRRVDLLDYGLIGSMLGPPPSYNKIVEMARKYGVDMPSDQKPHSKEKKK
jgi:hypothetical protein